MSDLVVRPVRFTDNVDGMRGFLEALGLRPRVEAESGGWLDMVAGGGMVALHSARDSARQAPSGLTSLSFEADDVAVVARRLEAAGVADVVVYDEAYGRVLTCRDPLGEEVAVDERSVDLYGYRMHDPIGVRPQWRVMPVRFADPLGPYGEFLTALGLRPRGKPDLHFTAYTLGAGDHGLVGLHPPTDRQQGGSGSASADSDAVALSFETAEDLGVVTERLTSAGFSPQVRTQAFGSVLVVADADGQDIEVHPFGNAA
jgi:hypothetical protein